MRHALILPVLVVIVPLSGQAQSPAEPDPWKFDELILLNGSKFVGLVLDDTAENVRFRIVSRQPGRATVTLTNTFSKRDVASTRKLPEADRKRLADRLAELDPSGKAERARMMALDLQPADWNGVPGAGKRYDSDYFTLITAAPDEIARRAAVRLEQLSAALRLFLPPQTGSPRPTTILLAPDLIQYRKLIGKTVGPVLNPALYDPVANRIVCGCDLARLGTELTGTRLHHEGQLADIDRYEAEIKKLYKGQKGELDRYLEIVRTQRMKVKAADAANEETFNKATGQLFAVLYHEAFHAYIGTFVYPPATREAVVAGRATGELPRWLNEGLAQVFETAILEAGELRVDHVDPSRLAKVQAHLKPSGKGLVPVPEILRAGSDSFLAAHADQRMAAGRAYLTSWAIAAHLLLEKRAIGGPAFTAYLKAVNSGVDPVKAFEAWVGTDAVGYEKELDSYLKKLTPNGVVK
jgi:hypothetical protein